MPATAHNGLYGGPLDDGAKGAMIAGAWIMGIFFIGLGGWAAFAPLNSAAVATAVVKVEGNRKSVQHLEGGIVKERLVKEGDKVAADQVLVRLDDAQARGAVEIFSKQYDELTAQEA